MLDKTSILYYFFYSGYFFYVLIGFPICVLCIFGFLYIIENSYEAEIIDGEHFCKCCGQKITKDTIREQ